MTARISSVTTDQVTAALAALGIKSYCRQHGVSLTVDFCEPCRVNWTREAAGHLRDLDFGGDVRDLAAVAADGTVPEGARIPTTLAEAADEVDALAAAIQSGAIS